MTGVTATRTDLAVECRGLTRSFGSTQALKGVDLEIRRGTIHALVGENGAGKSTCLGIIAGRISASAGTAVVNGTALGSGDPRAALAAGVAAVYQELSLLPKLTPHANVFLQHPLKRRGLLSQRRMRAEYERVCADLGVPTSPNVPTGELAVAAQQLIEIIRAVASDAEVLLLDEPTASLSSEERAALFRVLHKLKSTGTTIIWVSHNLGEVLANSDAITVFRDGRLIESRSAADWTHDELIDNMLGESSRQMMRDTSAASAAADVRHPVADREVLLEVSGVGIEGRLSDVSFTLHRGEVLGVAGLMGSGRTSLLRALAGLEPKAVGTLAIDGRPQPIPASPRSARRLGVGFVPEDRKTQGISLLMSCADNVMLADFGRASVFGYFSPRKARAIALPLMTQSGVLASKVSAPASTLSGGNQQKLMFARMSFQQPKVLLADEPTRGIDVRAKTEILGALRDRARELGLGIVLVSSELEELIAFCDRILVLRHGAVSQELPNTAANPASESQILRFAFDAGKEDAS